MADTHEPEVRSYNMSRIRSKNTKPELIVRKWLHAKGYRYRLHGRYKGRILLGKPDIILPKFHSLIFVHGCFWHGHKGCRYFVMPKSRQDYWLPKIHGNIQKDKKNKIALNSLGWKIITIWECQLKNQKNKKTLSRVIAILV